MSLSQRRERLVGRLRMPKTRAREGAVLVEGVRAVGGALDAGVIGRFVVVSPDLDATEAGLALRTRLARLDGLEVVGLDRGSLAALSDTERSQGVMLVVEEPARSLEAVQGGGRHLVLDGVQDPGNVGTLVRAAVAFAMDTVICLDGTVDPWSAKAVRASAGMIFGMPVVRAPEAEALARLATLGVPLYASGPLGDDVRSLEPPVSFAIAVGNEARGVRASVAEKAERTLTVRMPGRSESLNVAMAGSILLHELTREAAT